MASGYKIKKKDLPKSFYLYANTDDYIDLVDISATGSIRGVSYDSTLEYASKDKPWKQQHYILPVQSFAKNHTFNSYAINNTPLKTIRKGEAFYTLSSTSPNIELTGADGGTTYKLRLSNSNSSSYPYKLNVYKCKNGYIPHNEIGQDGPPSRYSFEEEPKSYAVGGTQILVAYCGAGGKGAAGPNSIDYGAGGGGAGSQIVVVDLMLNESQTSMRDIYIGLSHKGSGTCSYICRDGGDGVYASNGGDAQGSTAGIAGTAGQCHDISNSSQEFEEKVNLKYPEFFVSSSFYLASSIKGGKGGNGQVNTWTGSTTQNESSGQAAGSLSINLYSSLYTLSFSANGGLADKAGGGGACALGNGGDCENSSDNNNNAGPGGGAGGQNNTSDTPWNGGPGIAKIWFPTH